jgi:hypothetical protein
MALTLQAIRQFASKFVEADYDAQYHKYGEPVMDEYLPRVKTLGAMFDRGVKTRTSLLGGEASERKTLVRRRVMGVAVFEHPTRGEVGVMYLSGNHDYSQQNLDYIYYLAEVDGELKIITKHYVFTDGDRVSIEADGEKMPKLKKPTASEISVRPTHAAEAKLMPA